MGPPSVWFSFPERSLVVRVRRSDPPGFVRCGLFVIKETVTELTEEGEKVEQGAEIARLARVSRLAPGAKWEEKEQGER